jgi:hypothetical protein
MRAVTVVQLALGVNSISVKCAHFGMDRFRADRRGPLALSLVALPDAWASVEEPRSACSSSPQTAINNPPF